MNNYDLNGNCLNGVGNKKYHSRTMFCRVKELLGPRTISTVHVSHLDTDVYFVTGSLQKPGCRKMSHVAAMTLSKGLKTCHSSVPFLCGCCRHSNRQCSSFLVSRCSSCWRVGSASGLSETITIFSLSIEAGVKRRSIFHLRILIKKCLVFWLVAEVSWLQ